MVGDREVSWRVGDKRSGEGRGEWSKSEQVGNIPTEHSRGEARISGRRRALFKVLAIEFIAHEVGWAGRCLVRWLEMGTGQDESESGSGSARAD